MSETTNMDGMVKVTLPSGASYPVYAEEVSYVEDRGRRYMADNMFTNVADLADLDRVIIGELFCYRWSIWISRGGHDYWGEEINLDDHQKALQDHSRELRLIKKQLGIDKATRDKTKGESVADYIDNLLKRAKQFGVHRENQSSKAIEVLQRLSALMTFHKNLDDEERVEMHMTRDDLFDIIEKEIIPEFEKIDAYFREHEQKYFIDSL